MKKHLIIVMAAILICQTTWSTQLDTMSPTTHKIYQLGIGTRTKSALKALAVTAIVAGCINGVSAATHCSNSGMGSGTFCNRMSALISTIFHHFEGPLREALNGTGVTVGQAEIQLSNAVCTGVDLYDSSAPVSVAPSMIKALGASALALIYKLIY